MANTFFQTNSGRIPPNQEEIYQNISISSEDELSSIISVNTDNFVSFDSEPIEEAPPAYNTINQNAEEQREKNIIVDVNYITERFASEIQPLLTKINLLEKTIETIQNSTRNSCLR
ncbi:9685_t:CDS:2 [Cetraspora pellucida]|uniref:9685_t:CDS:1 n=1 Tax=Cetraspora pellucida TaxID=1433469 RepID=A0ACA9MQ29_9GLOM|nr:9685_t:CDS:2 [Cetraspora pellucida]